MPRLPLPALACAMALLTAGEWVCAVVDPSLQPTHILARYLAVAGVEVEAADRVQGAVTLRITQVLRGAVEHARVVIRTSSPATPGASVEELFDDVEVGGVGVAFIGKSRKGHEGDGLIYLGSEWHELLSDGAVWQWKRGVGDSMKGTFNGDGGRLLAMMQDSMHGRDFFPSVPFTAFHEERVLGTLAGPCRGVALYDIDGDGRLDAIAASEKGLRVYLQSAPLVFTDGTAALGLGTATGRSLGIADIDGDGRPDLLIDGVIHRNADGCFAATDRVPAEAARDLLCAAFAEIDGDGRPDVVLSRRDNGLAIFLNPGAAGGPFRDASAACAVDRPQAGAGETGFFAPGDWNGDGRCDLFLGVGKGIFLTQDANGTFAPQAHRLIFDFALAGGGSERGLTGAGAMAPLWSADSMDLAVAGDLQMTLAHRRDGTPVNVTGHGNETRQCTRAQIAILPEDLNMDGNIDLLTLSRDSANSFHSNRGYGSYMMDSNYMDEPFPGTAFGKGAWGAAAGDVDGDGTNDLLLGGADGRLALFTSDVLAARDGREENPASQERILCGTRLLTVRLTGQSGVLGATVAISAADGRILGRRTIGYQILTGCRGPDSVTLAVREPGKHMLTVRFADGALATRELDLTGERHLVVAVEHSQAAKP